MAGPRRIGIDTGGTFTDIVALSAGRLVVHKVPSTPLDPGQAVRTGLDAAREPGDPVDVVHGTTVGLNAVLTGDLARVAFVTNQGFEDLIEIGRQDRSDLYDLCASKTAVPVPRRLRFGISSRRSAGGERETKPSRAELRALRESLSRAQIDAIAIGLLHSYANPEDEHEIRAGLASLGLPITCSADLLRRSGEFERFTACILNAAIRPKVSTYLEGLAVPVQPGTLRLMRSSGGIMAGAEATEFPARAMFSGPAGGVLATRALARRAGYRDVAALDMGGTSTDVCLVRPETVVSDSSIGGLPLAIPAVEVHTVGCGGGSIARLDPGGALRVGPESAGADPGPACYGRGEEATVTDAHIALGHMGADTLLQGGFPIDPDRSVRAIEVLARRAGLRLQRAATGILEVAEVHMMRALLVITVQRAVDPAAVPLVAYGGAGGLHAAGLRRLLEMPQAIVPRHPGAFSAVGLALAGESAEQVLPVLRPLDSLSRRELEALARQTGDAAIQDLDRGPIAGGTPSRKTAIQIRIGLRYAGQGVALPIAMRWPLERTMAMEHQRQFGFVPEERSLEVVEIRVRAETRARTLPVPPARRGAAAPTPRQIRRAPTPRGPTWPVFAREDLTVGQELSGPCLIEEFTGVTLVPGGSTARVEPYGLVLTTP